MRSSPSAALHASLLALIAVYRRWISPHLPRSCRFYPTCSEYASDAIATHGVLRGVALATGRLARCHPWCEGGVDPVPRSCRRGRGRGGPARSSHTQLRTGALPEALR